MVDAAGIVGDRQGNRQHHGRPWQALCLFSIYVIDDLAACGCKVLVLRDGINVAGQADQGLDARERDADADADAWDGLSPDADSDEWEW